MMTQITSVEIVLPVFHGNLAQIHDSAEQLFRHFDNAQKEYAFTIVFAINGPNVKELVLATDNICRKRAWCTWIQTAPQGKGNGVIFAWENSNADILVYMDIDIATSLDSLDSLILGVQSGAHICIGSRYLPNSNLERSMKRYLLSVAYHKILIRAFLGLPVNDVQCGFKAISRQFFWEIRPLLRSYDFFFDAELVYVCHRLRKRILEIPVNWKESDVSSVKLVRTALSFFGTH